MNQHSKAAAGGNQAMLDRISAELQKIRGYTPKVGVFGNTGAGKSSLCNALFGKEIAEISDVEACTRNPQEIFIGKVGAGGIFLVDVPGVGEDMARQKEYIALYKSLVPTLDLVIWAIKSDDRGYASAIDAYEKSVLPNLKTCPAVFVITQADKVEPYLEWDRTKRLPSEKQLANLMKKTIDVSAKFKISADKIIAISANSTYNLVELVNKIVEILPNEKKYSFAREAKSENVSESAAVAAERGIFDYIKEFAADSWEKIKDEVTPMIVKAIPAVVTTIIAGAWNWLKKRL